MRKLTIEEAEDLDYIVINVDNNVGCKEDLLDYGISVDNAMDLVYSLADDDIKIVDEDGNDLSSYYVAVKSDLIEEVQNV